MKIYIAASWKHQHAVEMLTKLLREEHHDVFSFVDNNYGEFQKYTTGKFDFEEWVNSENADLAFTYDSTSAMECDMCIYIAPSGKDAAAEVGMAYAKGIPIIGLWAKGEDFGLMRKMMTVWHSRYWQVIEEVNNYALVKAGILA